MTAIRTYADDFTALVSTESVNARANTLTRATDTDVPIYWVQPAGTVASNHRAADDYADFYDGSWSTGAAGYNESGGSKSLINYFWAGSTFDGNAHSSGFMGSDPVAAWFASGSPGAFFLRQETATNSYPIVALSPVFQVSTPPANTAPTAADNTVTTTAGTAYAFTADDFGFVDTDSDMLASVKIVTVPAEGTLALGSTAVTVDDVVTKAQIDGSMLTFTPVAGASGTGYASFDFKVNDGTDDSASAYTMTIDVTAVNTPATGAPTITGTAQVGRTLTAVTTGIADANGLTSPTYTYQWIRVNGSDADIAAANSSTYTLIDADLGKTIKVKVSFTDDASNSEMRTSGAYPTSGTVQANNTLVSNAGQTESDFGSLGTFDIAQPFTTGANATGYTLSSIELTLNSSQITDTPTVKLYSGSANGTEVATFTGPAMLDAASTKNYTFTPASTVTVRRSTTYWVVAEGNVNWTYTDTGNEDANPAMGWSIADIYEFRTASLTGSFTTAYSGHVFQIRVNGTLGGIVLSNDATLSALALEDASDDSAIAISPTFASGTTSYTASVDNDVDEITINPAVNESNATVDYLDSSDTEITDANSGKTGQQVSLFVGANTIKVKVTAEDTTTTNPYTVVVTRAAAATNTAPTSADEHVEADEDMDYTFSSADFPFTDTDTGDSLASVKIVTLPASGTLTLSGTAIGPADLPQTVPADEIDDLKYSPPANLYGTDFASFTFKVNDGTVDSDDAYTMNIDVKGEDDPATGEPGITGTAQVGQTLTATVGTIADVDGLPNPFFSAAATTVQWIQVDGVNETDISGETESTYTLTADDVGKKVKVKVSFTDESGGVEMRTSAAYPSSSTVTAAAGVTVSKSALTVTEEDTTGNTYTLVLDTRPTANVTVTVAGHGGTDVTLTSSSFTSSTPSSSILTFTTANWNLAQTVTVKADNDTDTTNDMVTLTHSAASADSNYGGITIGSVVVTVADNDTARVTGADVTSSPASDNTYGTGEMIQFTVTFNQDVTVTGTPEFEFCLGSSGAGSCEVGMPPPTRRRAPLLSGSGTTALVFSYTVVAGDMDDNGIWAGDQDRTIKLETGDTIQGTVGGLDAVLTHAEVGIKPDHKVNGAPANTAPTAANNTVTTVEDTAYTFTADDFGFADTDTGATLASVKIVTAPTPGTLALDGTAVTANDVVTKADIDDDKLTFTPVAGASGDPYTTFTFKVNDGTVDSASAYTMTIDVTAAANTAATGAPTITGTGAGGQDADGLAGHHRRRQRADHPQLHVPVDPGGRHGRGGPHSRDYRHLHHEQRRPWQDPQGESELHRRRGGTPRAGPARRRRPSSTVPRQPWA